MDGESDERRPQQNSLDANFVAVRRGMSLRRSSMRNVIVPAPLVTDS